MGLSPSRARSFEALKGVMARAFHPVPAKAFEAPRERAESITPECIWTAGPDPTSLFMGKSPRT